METNRSSHRSPTSSLLYNGSRFVGHQKSKGNQYDVEVILQHVDLDNSYLCGYLKIKGLTEEFPTLTTFFDGEIISKKHPFLTRKWDADEDVDRKHWVRIYVITFCGEAVLTCLFRIEKCIFDQNFPIFFSVQVRGVLPLQQDVQQRQLRL